MITSGTVLESWDIILFGQHKFGQHLLTNVDFQTKWKCWKIVILCKISISSKSICWPKRSTEWCWPTFSKSKLQCLSLLNPYRRSSYLILQSFCVFFNFGRIFTKKREFIVILMIFQKCWKYDQISKKHKRIAK